MSEKKASGDLPGQGSDPGTGVVSCRLCGGKDFRLLHTWKKYSAWMCTCGLVRMHPFLWEDWWSPEGPPKPKQKSFTRFRHRVFRLVTSPSRRRFILSTRKVIPRGRLLDIGCGQGAVLEEAAPYYECVGVESSATAAAVSRQKGFNVVAGTFEEVELPPNSFDVVTAFSVIEHVYDPVGFLHKVNGLLKPGGVVALQVPKLNGPTHFLQGKNWHGFRVGYHLHLFTRATLGRALEMAGFQVLRHPRRDRLMDDVLILWSRKA